MIIFSGIFILLIMFGIILPFIISSKLPLILIVLILIAICFLFTKISILIYERIKKNGKTKESKKNEERI
jgi:F0F1-type ATP synthase assembly protein I